MKKFLLTLLFDVVTACFSTLAILLSVNFAIAALSVIWSLAVFFFGNPVLSAKLVVALLFIGLAIRNYHTCKSAIIAVLKRMQQ